MNRILIVGAGLSGAVMARELAEGGLRCLVIDKNTHLAGQCHTARDPESGVMVHEHGPHIFHTSNKEVWDYVRRFDTFHPFINRVKASNSKGVFSFPINLHTINQLYNKRLTPAEAKTFLESIRIKDIIAPQNAEETLLSMIGKDLYEFFFKGYTLKQWGISPKDLPAYIIKRIPIRYNYDDNYYNSTYQGMPESGYTELVRRILDHELIEVKLSTPFEHAMIDEFEHVFYSGPVDAFFDHKEGRLGYRTVDFERNVERGDQQGNAVINYSETNVPYTRQHQHDYFSPWESHEHSVLVTETSRATSPGDIPYYPVRRENDMAILQKYERLISQTENISFIGRLGCYRYLDMHQVIDHSLQYAKQWQAWKKNGGLLNKTSTNLMDN